VRKNDLLRKTRYLGLILLGLLCQMTSLQVRGQTETDAVNPIEAPFGLAWGETPVNIRAWAERNKFSSVSGRTKDGRDAIEIDGPFPDAEFDRLRFYFTENQLTEVELQFIKTGNPEEGADFAAITEAMAVKSRIDAKLGKGTLIKNEKGKESGKDWTYIQQIWTDEEHSIWLVVFTAKEPVKGCLALTSLHYRWEKKITEKMDKTETADH
jgi:hypothetical protein